MLSSDDLKHVMIYLDVSDLINLLCVNQSSSRAASFELRKRLRAYHKSHRSVKCEFSSSDIDLLKTKYSESVPYMIVEIERIINDNILEQLIKYGFEQSSSTANPLFSLEKLITQCQNLKNSIWLNNEAHDFDGLSVYFSSLFVRSHHNRCSVAKFIIEK